MKKFFLTGLACIVAFAMSAQLSSYKLGHNLRSEISKLNSTSSGFEPTQPMLNMGLGLSGWGVPVAVSYEFPIDIDRMSVVVGGSFSSVRESVAYPGGKTDWSHTIIGLQGGVNYYFDDHMGLVGPDWDLYGSLRLAYFIWNVTADSTVGSDITYSGSGSGGLGLDLVIGARYHLNDRWALHTESGWGSVYSRLIFGATMKI